MKKLLWKEYDLVRKVNNCPKIEEGVTQTYLPDIKKYIYFGGFSTNAPILSEKEQREKFSSKADREKNTYEGLLAIKNQLDQGDLQDYIYLFDAEENIWTRHQCKGRLPEKRSNHITFYKAPYFFIYGGITKENKILNTIYVLNIQTFVWRRFFQLEGPTPRLYPMLIDIGQRHYQIGGIAYPENLGYNDIWSQEFENVAWDSNVLELPGLVWKRKELSHGKMPCVKFVDGVQINESEMFFFGGYNMSGEATKNSYIINFGEISIRQISTKGKAPAARAMHKIIKIKENLQLLYGGTSSNEEHFKQNSHVFLNDCYVYYVKDSYWAQPTIGGPAPDPRNSFAISCNHASDSYYLNKNMLPNDYGIESNDRSNSDFSDYGLDLKANTSQILIMGGVKRLGTQSSKFVSQKLYILQETEDEMWKLIDPELKPVHTEGNTEHNHNHEELHGYIRGGAKPPNFGDESKFQLTLEFKHAEELMQKAKQEVSTQELYLKDDRYKNKKMREHIVSLEKDLVDIQDRFDNNQAKNTVDIENKKDRNASNLFFINRLIETMVLKNKLKKMWMMKILSLENAIRHGESFVITLDNFFSKAIQKELLDGTIRDSMFNDLIKMKDEHKNNQINFKDEYELFINKEKRLKEAKKPHKDIISELNIKEKVGEKLTAEQKNALKNFNLYKLP